MSAIRLVAVSTIVQPSRSLRMRRFAVARAATRRVPPARPGGRRRAKSPSCFAPELRGTALVPARCPRMYEQHGCHPSRRPPARVLVADDQPDVLEALRWLLTGEGYEPEFVSSTDAVLERLRERPFDLLLMDLNYTRDTTSGREGLELIPQRPRARSVAADRRDDRLGQHRHGGRGDAARRARASSRSRGRTSRCSRSCSARSRRRRRRKRRDAKQQREFEEARLIQRGLLPTAMPQIAGVQLAVVVAAGQRRRRRLLRRAAVRRRRRRRLDRRRRRQGRAGGAADVEPAGRGARVRAGGRRARRRSAPASTGCCAATWRAAGS